MVRDLMLAIVLQEINISPKNLYVTKHPECDRTIDKRSKLYQLKCLSVKGLVK
jgi:hypothetical protein